MRVRGVRMRTVRVGRVRVMRVVWMVGMMAVRAVRVMSMVCLQHAPVFVVFIIAIAGQARSGAEPAGQRMRAKHRGPYFGARLNKTLGASADQITWGVATARGPGKVL